MVVDKAPVHRQPTRGISYGIMAVTEPSIIDFFIYWLTLQMGYIDRPVYWLQYALKIRAYTNFFDKFMVI